MAEALTRAVENDGRLLGFKTKKGQQFKITQFADDTQFLLRGYDPLARMWRHIKRYERATNMRANAKMFEAFRLGRTKRMQVPDNEHTKCIRFVKPGESMMLGIPFWETGSGFDISTWWDKKYTK